MQLCDDVTEAIRTAEEPPAPPKEPLADLELRAAEVLIVPLAAARRAGRWRAFLLRCFYYGDWVFEPTSVSRR